MFFLGLILVILAGAVIAAAVINGTDPAVLDFSAFKIHTTEAGVFGIGAATLLVLVIGAWLLRKGLASRRRRRREVKELRKQVDIRERQAQELRKRQAEQSAQQEGGHPDSPVDSKPHD
jgi:ABC-type nickel/cobalt efflux system permease component RcnA